jgi:DnaJ-class molecular chaperone
MITKPLWTTRAIAAYCAGDEPCTDCGGRGRVQRHGRIESCPTCLGSGVPLSIKEAFDLGFSRDEWKVARQIVTRRRA